MGHTSNVVSLLSLNRNSNNTSNDFVSSETTASETSMIRVWQKLHLNSYFSLKNEIKLLSNRKLDSPLVLLPSGNLV